MIFFTSDSHFLDETTFKIDNRPFKNVKQCDKFIIKTWNKQAHKNDTIYVIGDFVDCDNETSTSWKTALPYVKKIKADVILITGNNEDRIIKYFFNGNFEAFRQHCLNLGFKEVYKNLQIEILGQPVYLTHKPKDYKSGVLNLFGHMHRGGGIYKSFGFNIGCDLNHFRLYSTEDIKFLLYLKKDFWDKDENVKLK